jgi:ribosome-associated protein
MLVVNPQIRIPLDEFQFTFARSGGPGGQNVNKVNSKATLRWPAARSPSLPEAVRDRLLAHHRRRFTSEGEIIITSQRFRDQARNVDDCLEKLQALLAAAAITPKPRKKSKPSRASKQRRLQAKRKRAETKSWRKSPKFES